MPIIGRKPIVVPEKVLDKYWVLSFLSQSAGPNLEPYLYIKMIPYNDEGDLGQTIDLEPIEIFSLMKEDKEGAMIYGQLLKWIEKVAQNQGKI